MKTTTRKRAKTAAEPWSPDELAVLDELSSPFRIQEFLSRLDYSTEPFYRSPRSVLRDRRANCVDGSFFGAAALRRLGFPPMIAELTAHKDDDHLLALFRVGGCWGAVAKSNTTVLRFREPVFRSLREMVMSYFEFYFNITGDKTLRTYSQPLRLAPLDALGWMTNDEPLDGIIDRLVSARHFSVLTPKQIASLYPVDPQVMEAGFLGADWQGLYDPAKHGDASTPAGKA